MLVPSTRWQRVMIVALLVAPLLVLLVLCTPGWLSWPFLPTDRRDSVLKFAALVVDWVKALVGIN